VARLFTVAKHPGALGEILIGDSCDKNTKGEN
jgi:hypothetical protein